MVYVHLFKHIYSHEGFHLASDSCRFSNQCPPNTAPPAPKIMGCSSSKIRSLKSRPPKPNPLQPTHLVYPTSSAMARHKSGKLRAIRVRCMFVFCSLPPYILHMPSLTKLSPCCLRGLCYHPVRLDSAGFGFCAKAIPCHGDSDSGSRQFGFCAATIGN